MISFLFYLLACLSSALTGAFGLSTVCYYVLTWHNPQYFSGDWGGVAFLFTVPAGAILGAITGLSVALWLMQRSQGIYRGEPWIAIGGGGWVFMVCFAFLTPQLIPYNGVEWETLVFLVIPMLWALLLLIWGLRVSAPTRRLKP